MIRQIHIENFKSIEKLTIDLGRINVFIGENGCGKSNVLEAIALAAAASRDMLDNEFLASRGIRVTEPKFMRAAFHKETSKQDIKMSWKTDGEDLPFECVLRSKGPHTSERWVNISYEATWAVIRQALEGLPSAPPKVSKRPRSDKSDPDVFARNMKSLRIALKLVRSENFLIYAPENTALRNFQVEGQILPLGSKGEGLFAHLRALGSEDDHTLLDEIVARLSLIDWFDRFELPANLGPGERTIHIRDRYLTEDALFDQRSANEGFLFLLFYFTLFISQDTPSFFAIDNVDTSLNPKLCAELLKHLAKLAEKHRKQAILTTHNPAVLDGLNLHDDEQRLFVIQRTSRGPTRARRILPPKPIMGQPPMKLSAAFLAGHIGGLPKNF
jgi:predicted ATPase